MAGRPVLYPLICCRNGVFAAEKPHFGGAVFPFIEHCEIVRNLRIFFCAGFKHANGAGCNPSDPAKRFDSGYGETRMLGWVEKDKIAGGGRPYRLDTIALQDIGCSEFLQIGKVPAA